MRTTLLPVTALLALQVVGQCPFDPTISPTDVILCPNSTELLVTQNYDSWQWYRDGVLIPGAMQHTYQVSSNDAGSHFTVACTLDGCTEVSPPVLVDGWVFLLPYVIHEGDAAYYTDEFGTYYCAGDTVILTLGQPYTENIQWTDGGGDIPGATGPVLIVTQNGDYSVSAAPGLCPDFILGLGVTISATFTPNIYPALVPGDGEVCVYPAISNAQWFLNGAPIGTGECIATTAPGVYTAFADYGQPCQTISPPFLFTGISGQTPGSPFTVVRIADELNVLFQSAVTPDAAWDVLDASGRIVRSGRVPAQGTLTVDLSGEAGGVYFFRTSIGVGQRFTLVR
ncbi:MAG: hypothetical protein ABI432_06280 [Flavobacteriales bacterium]